MLKNVLHIENAKALNKEEQKRLNGGNAVCCVCAVFPPGARSRADGTYTVQPCSDPCNGVLYQSFNPGCQS